MHRRTTTWAASGAIALGLLLGGCATSPSEEPMTARPEPVPTNPAKTPPVHPTFLPTPPGDLPGTPSGAPTDPAGDPITGPLPDNVLDLPGVRDAVAAEAQRRGVTAGEVAVVSYAAVTWSDGSIGCPQPGMMYTQALVPGHLLVLEVGGERASYHAAGHGFGYCADPIPPLPPEADTTR